MTNLYPLNSKQAWVGLSPPPIPMVAPGLTVVETASRYEVTVPLGAYAPEDVDIDLIDGMLIVSIKPFGWPSEDLDDVHAGERRETLTHYVMLGSDLERDGVSAAYLGNSLVISVRHARRRT